MDFGFMAKRRHGFAFSWQKNHGNQCYGKKTMVIGFDGCGNCPSAVCIEGDRTELTLTEVRFCNLTSELFKNSEW